MQYAPALLATINSLGLAKENILYLTIQNVFLHEIRIGEKNVEYRDLTPFYMAKLFKKGKNGALTTPKPITHLLLQGGYSLHSPRLLVELKGWDINGNVFPHQDIKLDGHACYDECINLILGKVVYDSHANQEFEVVTVKSRPQKAVVPKEITSPTYVKPINLVNVAYAQTGQSKTTNGMGMRQMQQKAYAARSAQYLLLKAPPASGKSRALMFIALDKLVNQGIKKAIVAVPERSIGNSFAPTNLTQHGFFADWDLNQHYNLCTPGGDKSKVNAFHQFLESEERILICTHATLRFAFEALKETDFNDCLLAIDEFHHVSADGDNKLGNLIRKTMAGSNAHIVAMTGSYFRGDSVPVLSAEDEAKFTSVTYNYYDQLNGYEYLKSLGIGYHFYRGRYYKFDPEKGTSALEEILDENLKTIIHIPSVASAESSKEKHQEVDHIIDCLGTISFQDNETGVIYVKSKRSGRTLKIADLVNDKPTERDKITAYLRGVSHADDIDMIIALGMAKEGFDWPYCEHALTIGYRGSLTETIQIIGRATRDSNNKTHAQYTNLIAQPDALDDDVKIAVNNMLKAISASLLMEQVLAPNFKFKPMQDDEGQNEMDGDGTGANIIIKIKGFKLPTSERARQIIEADLNDLKAYVLQNETMLKAMPGNLDPVVMNTVLIPQIIREKYPDLGKDDIEAIRQHFVVDSVIKNSEVEEVGDKKFLKMANSFVNLDDINIDLIDTVNPFQRAFEILSKNVTTTVLRTIQDTINITKIEMTQEEAVASWDAIERWHAKTGEAPDFNSNDPKEQRLAQALLFLQELKRKKMAANG